MIFFSELVEAYRELNKVVCQLFSALVIIVTAIALVEKDPDLVIFGVMFSIVTVVSLYFVVFIFQVAFDIIFLLSDIFSEIRDRR